MDFDKVIEENGLEKITSVELISVMSTVLDMLKERIDEEDLSADDFEVDMDDMDTDELCELATAVMMVISERVDEDAEKDDVSNDKDSEKADIEDEEISDKKEDEDEDEHEDEELEEVDESYITEASIANAFARKLFSSGDDVIVLANKSDIVKGLKRVPKDLRKLPEFELLKTYTTSRKGFPPDKIDDLMNSPLKQYFEKYGNNRVRNGTLKTMTSGSTTIPPAKTKVEVPSSNSSKSLAKIEQNGLPKTDIRHHVDPKSGLHFKYDQRTGTLYKIDPKSGLEYQYKAGPNGTIQQLDPISGRITQLDRSEFITQLNKPITRREALSGIEPKYFDKYGNNRVINGTLKTKSNIKGTYTSPKLETNIDAPSTKSLQQGTTLYQLDHKGLPKSELLYHFDPKKVDIPIKKEAIESVGKEKVINAANEMIVKDPVCKSIFTNFGSRAAKSFATIKYLLKIGVPVATIGGGALYVKRLLERSSTFETPDTSDISDISDIAPNKLTQDEPPNKDKPNIEIPEIPPQNNGELIITPDMISDDPSLVNNYSAIDKDNKKPKRIKYAGLGELFNNIGSFVDDTGTSVGSGIGKTIGGLGK